MGSFSPDIHPELLPVLVYCLVNNGLLGVSPDLHQLLLQLSQSHMS